MKIILIRRTEEYAAGPAPKKKGDASAYRVYTDETRAAAGTAALLFELSGPPVRSALLNAVDLGSERRLTDALRWVFGSGPRESMGETKARLRQFADGLERDDRDCIVVCGGLALLMLKGILRRRGYVLEGGELIPRPLDRVRATKQSLHCGGCHHNCLLTDAKCPIGQAKARERGIRIS